MVFNVRKANVKDLSLAKEIVHEIAESAKTRSTGITDRTPRYIKEKIMEGKAVIAYTKKGNWAGFCYLEVWDHQKYVANSGLIVRSEYRNEGLARQLKEFSFNLSRQNYPEAKIFGLTTSSKVMKINNDLGYTQVSYSELMEDEYFWRGCKKTGVNYPILITKHKNNYWCKTMVYKPKKDLKVG